MTNTPPFYAQLAIGASFIGARAQRLADLISEQGDEYFQSAGIVIPARSVSTVLYLRHNGPSSLVQIAKALHEPHQVTAKRTLLLEKLSMLTCKADPDDRRRRIFRLSRKGNRESALIEQRCNEALQVFENLNRELSLHLGEALDAAYEALSRKSMSARAANELACQPRSDAR